MIDVQDKYSMSAEPVGFWLQESVSVIEQAVYYDKYEWLLHEYSHSHKYSIFMFCNRPSYII